MGGRRFSVEETAFGDFANKFSKLRQSNANASENLSPRAAHLQRLDEGFAGFRRGRTGAPSSHLATISLGQAETASR